MNETQEDQRLRWRVESLERKTQHLEAELERARPERGRRGSMNEEELEVKLDALRHDIGRLDQAIAMLDERLERSTSALDERLSWLRQNSEMKR